MKPGLWEPLESSSRILTYLRKSAMLCTASSWVITNLGQQDHMRDGAEVYIAIDIEHCSGQLTEQVT